MSHLTFASCKISFFTSFNLLSFLATKIKSLLSNAYNLANSYPKPVDAPVIRVLFIFTAPYIL